MPLAQLSDCEIYYEEYGSGPPLMLIAGLGGVGSYWAPQIEEFAKHFRVIIHDHRGTGRSTKSKIKYSLEQMSADTLGLMDALGIDSAHIVGHSTGGAIAQILCLEHRDRVRNVVMYATWTRADNFFRRCFEVRRALLEIGPSAYIRGASIFLHPSWWVRDDVDNNESAVYGADFDTEITDSRIQAILDFDYTDRLPEITSPVLVVGVRNDHLTPAYYSEELARAIPGADLVILEDGAHVASQILPQEFNQVVYEFLSRPRRKRPASGDGNAPAAVVT